MSKNDITGDDIKSKAPSKSYLNNFDDIFRKQPASGTDESLVNDWNEDRVDIIGQNGNDGEHYAE